MNTLIIFSSPRQNGKTKEILNMLSPLIKGDKEIIDCYDLYYKNAVAPCRDCRYCFTQRGCSIKDKMTDIYEKIDNADNIIMALPVYFHNIPAPMKIVIDRCQTYWAAKIRGEETPVTKKLMSILVGGAPFFDEQFVHAEGVLARYAKDLRAAYIGSIVFSNSDKESPKDFDDIKKMLLDFSDKLNNVKI